MGSCGGHGKKGRYIECEHNDTFKVCSRGSRKPLQAITSHSEVFASVRRLLTLLESIAEVPHWQVTKLANQLQWPYALSPTHIAQS